MKFSTIILFVLFLSFSSIAQIVKWEPLFATVDDSITIVYDATQGNAGLLGVADIYAHTGVLTTDSSTPSDWKYVIADWNTNLPKAKMTPLGNNKWQLSYHIKSYYGLPANAQVTHLAFVFRNADGSRTGKTAEGGDIFIKLGEEGLQLSRRSPLSYHNILDQGENVNILAVSANSTSMELYIDGQLVKSSTSDSLSHQLQPTMFDKHRVKIVATDETETKVDSFYYLLRPAPTIAELPSESRDGITYQTDGDVTLVLHAPQKEFVYLVGDWNNWEADPAFYLNKTPDDERYWMRLPSDQLTAPMRYQYWVDARIRIADPYTELVLDPEHDRHISPSTFPDLPDYPHDKTTEILSVLYPEPTTFEWQAGDYKKPPQENLIIYELLLRDFLREHDFKTLTDTLGYFEKLGVNAIELMPFSEFEGNSSWGYNPSFYFAPDKYYGPKQDVQRFIDQAHKRGIAVIMDIVLNHTYGQSPMVRLYLENMSQSPWYNVTSPNPIFSWGYDFNHQSPHTQAFIDRVTEFWLTEYKVDGFRFDFTKGFTNTPGDGGARDNARIAILKRMADAIWAVDPTAFVILEHFTDNSEEKELAEYGMMIWGNSNYNYNEATMGYHENGKSDFSWGSYKRRGWNVPNLVTFMESHDEERLMYKNLQYGASNGSYSVQDENTALSRIETAAALFFTIPGPKMFWQFGELGYDYSIDYNGRVGEKPIRWNYLNHSNRKKLQHVFAELIHLKQEHAVFSTSEFVTSFASSVKWLKLYDDEMNVFVIGNFDIVEQTVSLSFPSTGMWHEYFTNQSLDINSVRQDLTLAPGEYRLYTSKLVTRAAVAQHNIPESTQLGQNYPNPFNPVTTIRYSLPASSQITLEIFNIQGQKIKTLYSGSRAAGQYEQIWDSRDDSGRLVPSGLYLYKLATDTETVKKKMLLIR